MNEIARHRSFSPFLQGDNFETGAIIKMADGGRMPENLNARRVEVFRIQNELDELAFGWSARTRV